jgi:hypothetical protein
VKVSRGLPEEFLDDVQVVSAPGKPLWRFGGLRRANRGDAAARFGFELRPELAYLQPFGDPLPELARPHSEGKTSSRWGRSRHGSAVIIVDQIDVEAGQNNANCSSSTCTRPVLADIAPRGSPRGMPYFWRKRAMSWATRLP